MLDPSTSGYTGGRAGKERAALGKKLQCVKFMVRGERGWGEGETRGPEGAEMFYKLDLCMDYRVMCGRH